MPASIAVTRAQERWVPPAAQPLSEAVWQAWRQKDRAEEESNATAHLKPLKWLSIAVLVVAAGLWASLSTYDAVVRSVVAATAAAIALDAIYTRHFAAAGLFGTLAVVYNPVAQMFHFAGDWQRALAAATAIPFLGWHAWRNARLASTGALAAVLMCGAVQAADGPVNLSKYRNFQLGADLATVAGQADINPTQAKIVEQRPALIQELTWRPEPLGPSAQMEAAKDVLFRFYNGQLFQISVNYDRYRTEGLTASDVIETVSAVYGPATAHPVAAKGSARAYGETEEILARWEDAKYRLDLVEVTYGPTFRLIATARDLEAPVEAALAEARRLNDKEAPQRDAARVADQAQAERTRLEKARLVNKPNFRP